jgi:hypothetical protein
MVEDRDSYLKIVGSDHLPGCLVGFGLEVMLMLTPIAMHGPQLQEEDLRFDSIQAFPIFKFFHGTRLFRIVLMSYRYGASQIGKVASSGGMTVLEALAILEAAVLECKKRDNAWKQ